LAEKAPTKIRAMQLRNSARNYGLVSQSVHWLTVALVVIGWVFGMVSEDLPRGAARDAGHFVHMTAGLTIIALLALRLAWRVGNPPPPPEPTILGPWGDRAAKLTHVVLYALLAAAPIAGIVAQFARGNPVPVFGLFDIASPWAADRAFARSVTEVHEVLANLLLIIAALHAAAALIHHWVLRDRTLRRMFPGHGV
jgi:cytochrome b561